MDIDDTIRQLTQIFLPGTFEEYTSVVSEQKRFVYYTSAHTALSILKNRELWFRNVTVMNDFSEISYGLSLLRNAFSCDVGKRFRQAVDDIFPNTIAETDTLLSAWENDWKFETYIACVSVHNSDEDQQGRLSMWRAYGNTAIVVKNTPIAAITDKLSVYSMPVLYLSLDDLEAYLEKITGNIRNNMSYLKSLEKENIINILHHMSFRFAIATKHPGFKEEQEWRIYYRPSDGLSGAMTQQVVVLNNVPQKIFKLKLANEPDIGLYGADIPSLLDRIIIGPTEFPYVSHSAFTNILEDLGVQDAASKVICSDIPLRTS